MEHLFASPKFLRAQGVLGLNERNKSFIKGYNERRLFPLVDNKSLTKEIALKAGLPVPSLYHTVRFQAEVKHKSAAIFNDLPGFCVKPARGAGGKGILVVTGRDGDNFITSSGQVIGLNDIQKHMSNALAGLFSLGGSPDEVLVEHLVKFDPRMDKYAFQGVPDVRVIVFQGVPVMAMMRCPTQSSDGKANLHQGAIGVGISLTNGTAVAAVQNNALVEIHPDTKHAFSDLQVPNWDEILQMTAKCYEVTKLGYLGCDIVIDEERGPLLLELNARPGLSIQIANQEGLRNRLIETEYAIDTKQLDVNDIDARIGFAVKKFGR